MSITEVEEARAQWLWHHVESRRDTLAHVGLDLDVRPVRRTGSGQTYESELEVTVRLNRQVVDALYYRVYKGERLLAGDDEFYAAVDADISDLVSSD